LISIEVIRKSKEFLEVISNGRKFTRSGVVIYYLKNSELDILKFGISIKKQSGNAVIRNKLRRQIRSLARDNFNKFTGIAMVVIIMNNNLKLDYMSLKEVFDSFDSYIKNK